MNIKTKTYIYILIDPITNQIRYVGKTNNPKSMLKNHKNECRNKNTHKRNWLNSLLSLNKEPIMEVIDTVLIEDWKYWEKFWIGYYKFLGCNLTNCTNGGDGLTFGNKTSFKKGDKSWNEGNNSKSACVCEQCGKEFNYYFYSNKIRKLCSQNCSTASKKKNLNKGTFSKNTVPWNKGLKGSYIIGGLRCAKIIIRIDKVSGKTKKYKSANHAAKDVGCTPCNIRNCCSGKSKSAKGYFWKYKN